METQPDHTFECLLKREQQRDASQRAVLWSLHAAQGQDAQAREYGAGAKAGSGREAHASAKNAAKVCSHRNGPPVWRSGEPIV